MNIEPITEKIIRAVEKLSYKFSIRPIASQRTLITVHYDSRPTGFNCVLDILDGNRAQINFLIRYPRKLNIDQSPDILLFTGLANSYRTLHNGYWNFDIENGELIYCYQWHCDPTGLNFDLLFSGLLLNCCTSFDNAREALKNLIDEKINAEQAVGDFIKRTTAFFN